MTPIDTLISYSPATGEEVGRYPDSSAEVVHELVARARAGSLAWRALGFKGRKVILKKWAALMASRIDELAQIVMDETGKPKSDATLEVTLAIGHLAWAANNAPRFLRTSNRAPGLIMANMSAKVQYVPFGVIGVIGPWNYPVYTPMGSIAYSLAAGNSVVFKPSEFTPGVGFWLGETFNEVARDANVFFVVTGGPATGVALTQSAIDKVAFTGSTRTAKKVAASCAERMIPVVLECGGSDAAIIDVDADISAAADAVLWGAMSNSGQTCIGTERVYVMDKVADKFIAEIKRGAEKIKPGKEYGAITMPSQLKVIDSHIRDAASKGAEFVVGSVDSVQAPYVNPTIMVNVPEDSLAVVEETFGPTLVINRVSDVDEAIRLSNGVKYGLAASVWSKKNADYITSQLQCGMVSVNSVIAYAGIATLPFGGVKESGYGRIHGREGLREFTYLRSVAKKRFSIPLATMSFTRKASTDALIKKLAELRNR